MRKQIGFTLIELMVTIALMGIFAAFALPAMNGFIDKQRTNSTVANYSNAITFARNEAVRLNVPVVVCGASISTAGQLAGCANNTVKWTEGLFVYADVNKDHAYNVSDGDLNLRVVQSPNKPNAGSDKVTITSASSKNDSTSTAISSNPVFQFLPNGQVARFSGSNVIVADMYLKLKAASTSDAQKFTTSLMDPTGQIIKCNNKVKSANTGNKIATLCAN